MFAIVRHKGFIWKVRKHDVESEEVAQDRAWYIALNMPMDASVCQKESMSRQWANEKYYRMQYNSKNIEE